MSLEIMNKIFQLTEKSYYNLRYTSEFIIPPIHIVYHGSESVSYLGLKIWELIPLVIRQIDAFRRMLYGNKDGGLNLSTMRRIIYFH